MLVALGLNLIGIAPVHFLFLAAVLNGLTAPILMAVVWLLARDKNLLGKWASPRWSQILLGVATIAMASLPVFWWFAG
jgi:Mn2+/Fe2+ NRAMP family transporter